MNNRLGNALGRNPHGEPLYKWIWVNDWEHFMRDISGFKPTAQPSGLIVMEPQYVKRRMIPDLDGDNKHLKDRWHIGHWHDCGDEATWRSLFGTAALWSRFGVYTQTDIWSPQGQLPTETITDDLILRVKQFRSLTAADIRNGFAEKDAKFEAANDQARRDMIADAMTAYGNVPGTKGSTSFPTPTSMIQPPTLARN